MGGSGYRFFVGLLLCFCAFLGSVSSLFGSMGFDEAMVRLCVICVGVVCCCQVAGRTGFLYGRTSGPGPLCTLLVVMALVPLVSAVAALCAAVFAGVRLPAATSLFSAFCGGGSIGLLMSVWNARSSMSEFFTFREYAIRFAPVIAFASVWAGVAGMLGLVGLVASLAMLLVSCGLLFSGGYSGELLDNARTSKGEGKKNSANVLRLVSGCFSGGVIAYMATAGTTANAVSSASGGAIANLGMMGMLAGVVLGCLLLTVACLALPKKTAVSSVEKWAFSIMEISLACGIAFPEMQRPALFFAAVGMTCYLVALLNSIAAKAFVFELNRIRHCVLMGSYCFMSLLAGLLITGACALRVIPDVPDALPMAIAVAVLLLNHAFEAFSQQAWDIMNALTEASDAPSDPCSTSADQDFRDAFASSCAALSKAHGLTPRETEVLELLARGRNAERISALLSISIGTTRGHISRALGKAGIENQQELISLVEASVARHDSNSE